MTSEDHSMSGGGEAGVGEAAVRRYLDRTRGAAIAEGRFDQFLRGYLDHVRRWELPMDGLCFALMREALAAGTLHLSTRPLDESFGLTLNVRTPPLNVFVAGDASGGTITGRAFVEGVKTARTGRLYLESYRPGGKHSRSTIEVDGLDALLCLEEYYERSEQSPARFFDLEEDRFAMIRLLPDGDTDWIRGLDREEAAVLLDGGLEALEERVFIFRCGCNPEKILAAVRKMFTAGDLFADSDEVETSCPRCGARRQIRRSDFEAESS